LRNPPKTDGKAALYITPGFIGGAGSQYANEVLDW